MVTFYEEYKGYYVISITDDDEEGFPKDFNITLPNRYNGLPSVISYGYVDLKKSEDIGKNTYYEEITRYYAVRHNSMKVKGMLRITRDLTLTKDNSQIHMMLFLDKNTPKEYLFSVKTEKPMSLIELDEQGFALTTTWYVRSPYENDRSNQKLLKTLLSEKEYALFMSKRFSCTYAAVECEISDFMSTTFYSTSLDYQDQEFYTDKYSIGNDISIKAEYFLGNKLFHGIISGGEAFMITYKHALMKNYKVIGRYDVSIYMSNKYNEDYFYSSYAKNGVLALPCSNDKYINVREKPNKDGRIILKIANVLQMFYLPVYNRERNVVDRFYERETEINKIASRSKEEQIKLMQYKIYPIFVNDILKGDWCKVTIYKSKYMFNFTSGIGSPEVIHAGNIEDIHNLRKKIVYSHDEVFLMNGYIHASQLHPISVIRVKDTV